MPPSFPRRATPWRTLAALAVLLPAAVASRVFEPPFTGRAPPKAVLFDADGTLLDSLPPHIDFLHARNAELPPEHRLTLPARDDLSGCRALAAAPMEAFFRRAGFQEDAIGGLVAAYDARFGAEHPVRPFPLVRAMLMALRARGVRCAVVSSNTAANVRCGLGPDLVALLDCVLGVDDYADKAEAIPAALRQLGLAADEAVYVGDTAKDGGKAMTAAMRFAGVGYGFEDLAETAGAQGLRLDAMPCVDVSERSPRGCPHHSPAR